MNDPTFLAKIGERMGDTLMPPESDAGPPPPAVTAAAAPTEPPEIRTVLDAAKYGDLEAIEDFMAIGKGGDADEEGRTALHYAVAYDQPAAVEALLAAGASAAVTDNYQNTPLHYAAGYARIFPLVALLRGGADVQAVNGGGQKPADVVRLDDRNPLNRNERAMAVLDGAAPPDSLTL
jgi:hypothetical protein